MPMYLMSPVSSLHPFSEFQLSYVQWLFPDSIFFSLQYLMTKQTLHISVGRMPAFGDAA